MTWYTRGLQHNLEIRNVRSRQRSLAGPWKAVMFPRRFYNPSSLCSRCQWVLSIFSRFWHTENAVKECTFGHVRRMFTADKDGNANPGQRARRAPRCDWTLITAIQEPHASRYKSWGTALKFLHDFWRLKNLKPRCSNLGKFRMSHIKAYEEYIATYACT